MEKNGNMQNTWIEEFYNETNADNRLRILNDNKDNSELDSFREKLWIARKRERGELNVRYDASNEDYLELLFDYAPRYKEEDLRIVMEMYADYGSKNFGKITNDNKRNVS